MAKTTIEDYEKRLCISYLDEVDAFICEYYLKAMVSFTALKEDYIKNIEQEWKAFREAFNIPSGVCLHFSDIKFLLSKQTEKYNPIFYNIFKDASGSVDYGKMHSFYIELLKFIDKNNFVLQATGIKSAKKLQKVLPRIEMNSIMYQLFSEHLDRVVFYMVDLTIEEYRRSEQAIHTSGNFNKLKNLEPSYYFTKLRYDGSYVLTERNDYRNAFSHCIADGTKHFSSNVIKEVFDNLNFVAKREVGLSKSCCNPCDIDVISHAGAEIVDFAALYIGRSIWKDFFRDYQTNTMKLDAASIDSKLERDCMITIPGYPKIDPMLIIDKKVFESPDVIKYKRIEDYPF